MPVWTFALLLEGNTLSRVDTFAALERAGCSDVTYDEVDGEQFADFTRAGTTFAEAFASAVTSVEEALPGVTVVGMERRC